MKYQDYNGQWEWENFTPEEIACRCCGELWKGDDMPVYFKHAMHKLQDLRNKWGKPIVINSGHRCTKHNAEVGGATQSQHLTIAFDCVCPRSEQSAFAKMALEVGFHVARPYPDNGFVHLDMGRPRTW